jgi:uncharacterized iron-regulated protein
VRTWFLLSVMVMLLSGCASTGPKAAEEASAARFFDGATGAPAAMEQVVAAGAGADALVLGENHGHPLGLATAAAIWKGVLEGSPNAALALEFFERDEQARLDEYLAGLVDEKAFRTRTNRTPSNYPNGHRDMVEAAKAAGRPVYASNAPLPQVRAASRQGYDKLRSLSGEQRRMVRIPDEVPTGRYRDDFDTIMGGGAALHGAKPEDAEAKRRSLDSSFRAQSLWDWTMADSIVSGLAAGARPVCLVVGRFHSDFRGGLISALDKLRPGAKVVTVSFVDEWSAALRDEDKERADFVVYVGPAPK